MQQEVFIHDEEGADFHITFEADHDFEQFVTGLIKVHELALTSEHRRGGAEVASHGTADGGDQCSRHVAGLLAQAMPLPSVSWNTHAGSPHV